MSFPRYPKYKDSCIEWLGDVPDHWNAGSVRWLTRRYSGGTPDKTNLSYWEGGTIPWLNSGAVNDRLIKEPSTLITVEAFENSSAKWIPEGALVMALAGQGKTKGMVAQLAIRTTCNQSMAAIIPGAEINPRFLFWWLDSNYENIRNMAGGDLRDGLNLELLGNIRCPLPTSREQTTIASFLDRETAKIDGLVGEQRRLIELLKEKRQAVISHAVTKGLNPHAPLKPSGIEWLGDVPKHWSVKAVRHACQIDNTLRFPIDAQTRSDIEGKFPYYGPTGILSWINECRVDGDYFLLGEDGDHFLKFAHQPMTVRVTGKFNVNNHAHVLRGVGECSTDWAATYFKHKDLSPWLIKQGVGRLKLRKETLQTIPVLIPPRTEQSAILAFLDAETAKLNALTAEAERAIELLQERRTALISAAVTGKIDVRGLVETEAA